MRTGQKLLLRRMGWPILPIGDIRSDGKFRKNSRHVVLDWSFAEI